MSTTPTRTQAIRNARAKRAMMVRLARTDVNTFCELVLKDEKTGEPVWQAPTHYAWHELADKHDRLLIWAHIESGKALAIDTPIPIPSGWTTMDRLRLGDAVFAGDGSVTHVTFATPVQRDRVCYRVCFSDGSDLVADAEHLWLAWTDDGYAKGRKPLVVSTAEMLRRGVTVGTAPRKYPMHRWRVPLATATQHPTQDLPLHPYVLGAWLGDGDATRGRVTFHPKDRFVFDHCLALTGWKGGKPAGQKNTAAITQGMVARSTPGDRGGLTSALKSLGVLGHKHIPLIYLCADEDQRMNLLAGLLDTDGHAGPKNRVEFSTASTAFGMQVLELARSLGFKASLAQRPNHVRVTFTAWRQVFRLPRKAAAIKARERTKSLASKTIIAIEPSQSVPVRCIQVKHPDHTYLAGRAYTVTHNTQQLSIGRTLWELGRDPALRCLVLSNTKTQASKLADSIRRYIEQSSDLHDVFPHLLPGEPWGSNAFSIKRSTISKDPSIQTAGVHGNIQGARLDRVLLDDVLDYENTQTEDQRKGLIEWYGSAVGGRIVNGGRVRGVGTAFHPQDILHHFARQGWAAFRYPVVDVNGHPRWAERWPLERIAQKVKELGPIEAQRQLMCEARDDSSARFKRDWVELALRLGEGTSLASALHILPPGYRTFTGVDLAVQQKDANDWTVLFTIAVDPHGNRNVLNVESGKWAGPEIVTRIHQAHVRYQSIIIVENNAAQDFILQFARQGGSTPMIPFTTGRNKAHPEFGIESIAAEMAGGKWRIPNHNGVMHPEVSAWVDEMLFYNPAAHTGDRLMASWFAREGARLGTRAIENHVQIDFNRR